MTYVHFDREAIAAAVRKAAKASYEIALAAAPNETSRDYVRAQARFDDVVAEAFAVCIDLKNEGKSEEMIAGALGTAVGALIGNLLSNVSDSEGCLLRINHVVVLSLKNAASGCQEGFSSAEPVFVNGQAGGRA